jgi:hypothetical protein
LSAGLHRVRIRKGVSKFIALSFQHLIPQPTENFLKSSCNWIDKRTAARQISTESIRCKRKPKAQKPGDGKLAKLDNVFMSLQRKLHSNTLMVPSVSVPNKPCVYHSQDHHLHQN